MRDDRRALEAPIRSAFHERDYDRSATLALKYYGPELLGFLIGHLRDREAADEVFSDFSERLWESLPSFEWRCSMRTWAYKIARYSASNYSANARRRRRELLLSHAPGLPIEMRTTDITDHLQALRAQLSDEDQALLLLRVDSELSWLELAEIKLARDTQLTPEVLKTEAARLRKRFQLVKEQLRKRIEESELL